MVRVSVEVDDGTARFQVTVQAGSVRRALEIAGDGTPGRDVRVVSPLDPDTFFAGGSGGAEEAVDRSEEVA